MSKFIRKNVDLTQSAKPFKLNTNIENNNTEEKKEEFAHVEIQNVAEQERIKQKQEKLRIEEEQKKMEQKRIKQEENKTEEKRKEQEGLRIEEEQRKQEVKTQQEEEKRRRGKQKAPLKSENYARCTVILEKELIGFYRAMGRIHGDATLTKTLNKILTDAKYKLIKKEDREEIEKEMNKRIGYFYND